MHELCQIGIVCQIGRKQFKPAPQTTGSGRKVLLYFKYRFEIAPFKRVQFAIYFTTCYDHGAK